MKRTSTFMTAVAASLVLTGNLSAAAPQTSPPTNANPQEDASKTDPQVNAAADQIDDWLTNSNISSGKTRQQILDHFPTLSPSTIDKALKLLVEYRRRVHKFGGDDDPLHPSLYYEVITGGGGG